MRKFILVISILSLCCWPAITTNAQSIDTAGNIYGFRFCRGDYALCESSICAPTGGTIEVNVAGGGHASFPEAECTCPILGGVAIADVTGGNMTGSCARPGKDEVWSLYAPKSSLPQEINNWGRRPAATKVEMQLCPSSLGEGQEFANCFSFACIVNKKPTKGVRTATCFCPLGENLDGTAVDANTAFVTPAGQCNQSVCSEHPVGAAATSLNGQGAECIDLSSNATTENLNIP